MKTFQYKGKSRTAIGDKLLFPGCNYDLDESKGIVKSFVAQGLLTEIKPASMPAPAPINNSKDNKK